MKVSKLLFLAVLMLAFGACARKKTHSTSVQTVQTEVQTQIQTEKIKIVETFTYNLESNNCSTGAQVFSTVEQMCQGLQDNTLNNNCALELREDFFAKNCAGKEFVAFDDNTKNNEVNYNNVIEQKKLKGGDIVVESTKTTPVGTSKKAASVPFSCAASLADGLNLEKGVILLNGAKALINRDQSKIMRRYPQVLIECSDAANEKTSEVVDAKLIKNVSVKVGHGVVEYITLSNDNNVYSELTYIHCAESKTEIMETLTNGVNLLKGSKILVKRDIAQNLLNGVAHPLEFSLISCE